MKLSFLIRQVPAAYPLVLGSRRTMFEVLLEDDRLMFPNHFKNGSASA
jgi:hypothetical protein